MIVNLPGNDDTRGGVDYNEALTKDRSTKGHLTFRLVLLSVWGISLVLALPQVLATWCW